MVGEKTGWDEAVGWQWRQCDHKILVGTSE